MTHPHGGDGYEARVLARLDALPPPRSAEELRRLGPPTRRELEAARLRAEDDARIEAWRSAQACECWPGYWHTNYCARIRALKARTA